VPASDESERIFKSTPMFACIKTSPAPEPKGNCTGVHVTESTVTVLAVHGGKKLTSNQGAIKPVTVAPNAVAAVGLTHIAFAAVGTSGVVNVLPTENGEVVVPFVPNCHL
jgi:hypothetical protein